MLVPVFLIIGLFSLQGTTARRCHISSNFQRYCGTNTPHFRITPEQCRAICDSDRNCMVGHWHPGNQIWKSNPSPVCFLFRADDPAVKVCPWGNAPWGITASDQPGAKMIRCSVTDNNEIERCSPSANFQRHCGANTQVRGQSSERCRQTCNDRTDCHVAHWHPGNEIWKNDDRSVCFMFPKGAPVCPWNGGELIKHNPGAQMFRCRQPTIKSFSYDMDAMSLLDSAPDVLGTTVIVNNCPKEYHHRCPQQSKTLTVSRSTTSSKSWSHEAGVSVTVGTEFSAGAPILASGSVSVDVSASYSHTWGTEETEEKTWQVEEPCVAGAGMKVTCEFFVTKKRVHVPFTIVWSTGQVTKGIYKGVDFFYGGTTTTPEFLSRRK